MSRIAGYISAIVLCIVVVVSADARRNSAFSFVGARDFVRSFAPASTPIMIDSTANHELESTSLQGIFTQPLRSPFAPFVRGKSPESLPVTSSGMLRIYPKAFDREFATRKTLLQAQAVLFQSMRQAHASRDDKDLYLALATLEYRLNGLYHLRHLMAYVQAFIQAGGSRKKLPKILESILDFGAMSKTTVPSLKQILPTLLHTNTMRLATQDLAIGAHVFLPGFAKGQGAFIRTFTQGTRSCVGIVAQDSKDSTKGFTACLPYFVDELVLFPFDEKLYIIGGDRIYLAGDVVLEHAFPTYATIQYQEINRPTLCPYAAGLFDEEREKHLASDLVRAGYGGVSTQALHKWQEDFMRSDEKMLVEYLGYFDVFNDGTRVPLARTHTAIIPNLPLYEAFTLDPTSLQADIILSHPSMSIDGRIPSLFFIHYDGEIVGCVRDEAHREEKLFRFYKDRAPELIKHNRLERSLLSINEAPSLSKSKSPQLSQQSMCRIDRLKPIADARYGLLALGEHIILEARLCDERLQRDLLACKSVASNYDELECRLDRIGEAVENVL